MADSDDNRKWLVLIVLGALLVMLWEDGPNLFHFHWDLPFWPAATVVFALWWMSGGKHKVAAYSDCDDEGGEAGSDVSEEAASDDRSDENDEKTANKA